MDIQAHIPAALCAIHNFIQHLNSDTFFTPEFQAQCLEEMQLDEVQGDDNHNIDGAGVLTDSPVSTAKWWRAAAQWDFIVQQMWKDYMRESRE